MNKVLKGLVAVAATAAMAVAGFAGASTAMADTVNVTVPGGTNNTTNLAGKQTNLTNHAFTAYQILTGTQADSGDALGDAKWGSGINVSKFVQALKQDTTLKSFFINVSGTQAGDDATEFAKVLGNTTNFPEDSANTRLVAKIAMKNKTVNGTALTAGANSLATGYYLIVDSTTTGGQTVYNPAVLAITRDITIKDKTDVPTLQKKVEENKKNLTDDSNKKGDAKNIYGGKFNDVADYNIGDSVPFHLIGSVPDMSQYETYTYKFTDTFDNGFGAVDESNVKVYLSKDKKLDLGNVDTTQNDTDITQYFTGENGKIAYTAATEAAGGAAAKKATLEVSTKNLKDAATYDKENPQYVIVSYSAKLNDKAVIGKPGNVNEAVLTYANKPDQSGQGENQPHGTTPEDKVIVFTYGLDVTKYDAADKDKTGTEKTKLKDAEFNLFRGTGENVEYVQVDDNKKVTGWTKTEADGSILKSDKNGNFKVTGLDDGSYTLKETKAPAGYNLPANGFSVVLTATTANDQSWDDGDAAKALTGLAVSVDSSNGTADTTTGTGSIAVYNTKGSSLPTTGGMGTVLLYVAGIAVFVLAGATLVMALRRRNA